MRILVTGGTGFIGSHLIPKLIEKGYDVWSLERYVAGRIGQSHDVKTVYEGFDCLLCLEEIRRLRT